MSKRSSASQPRDLRFFEMARSNDKVVIRAGAAAVDVTPSGPVFLYGYPHHERLSNGMHDPLLASALCLVARREAVVFVCVDTIWLSKELVAQARQRIASLVSIPPDRIIITATHTHSGPTTVRMLSNLEDPVVPPPDPQYLTSLVDGIVLAATTAASRLEPAALSLLETECAMIGSNRLDPNGPTIESIPVLAVKALEDNNRFIGLMYVNRSHPTVLHEDSLVISSDFPGACRSYLQTMLLGENCPVLSPLGAAGNQSPRYVTRANTLGEVKRLGTELGNAILAALDRGAYVQECDIECHSTQIDLPPRKMPTVAEAEEQLELARKQLAESRQNQADPAQIRTAECAVFGAEETLCLAKAAVQGTLNAAQTSCLPAEIVLVRIGPWIYVAWPGEVFAEFAITVRRQYPNVQVITLANGELQGYLVTAEAVENRTYESDNSVFASPTSGNCVVEATLKLLQSQDAKG